MEIEDLLKEYNQNQESLIPILDEIQEKFGYVSKEQIGKIAKYLAMEEKEIYLRLKFKKNITLEKVGRNQIIVCKGANCLKNGSVKLVSILEKELGIKEGETTKDGKFSLFSKNCFKKCGLGPNVEINGKLYHQVTTQKLMELLDQCK